MHSRGAMQARAALDALRGVEHGGQLLRVVAVGRDADDACAVSGRFRTMNSQTGNVVQPFKKPRYKARMVGMNRFNRFRAQEIGRRRQAGQAGKIVVARLILVGQFAGLAIFFALSSGSTAAQRLQRAKAQLKRLEAAKSAAA